MRLFITRYMRPGGPWQQLCRCPFRGNGGIFYKETLCDLEPAYAVIVRYLCAPAPHGPPDTRKRKINQAFKDRNERKENKGVHVPYSSISMAA